MLIPVDLPDRQRIWIDLAVQCEVHADSQHTLARYILKYAHVRGTYTDDQISGRVRRSFAGMIHDGVPRYEALQEISEAYGIAPAAVQALVEDAAEEPTAAST